MDASAALGVKLLDSLVSRIEGSRLDRAGLALDLLSFQDRGP